jgi:hypothetical protein
VEELIPSCAFHFSSVLVRRDCVRFPEWFSRQFCADRPLFLPNAYARLKKARGGVQA